MNKLKPIMILLFVISCYSCVTVKEYNKQKINDPDMDLSSKNSERFETNSQTYREGSAGANGGKSGGGCGCN